MRSKEEILKTFQYYRNGCRYEEIVKETLIEVLIDIRDLLYEINKKLESEFNDS